MLPPVPFDLSLTGTPFRPPPEKHGLHRYASATLMITRVKNLSLAAFAEENIALLRLPVIHGNLVPYRMMRDHKGFYSKGRVERGREDGQAVLGPMTAYSFLGCLFFKCLHP
jgi:hypothetical protein